MCSMSSYLEYSGDKALFFEFTGSFSISNVFILKLKLKFWSSPGGNINYLFVEKNKNEVCLAKLQSKCFQLEFIWHYFVYNLLVPHAHCRYHISVLCFIFSFPLPPYPAPIARLNFQWYALVICLSPHSVILS